MFRGFTGKKVLLQHKFCSPAGTSEPTSKPTCKINQFLLQHHISCGLLRWQSQKKWWLLLFIWWLFLHVVTKTQVINWIRRIPLFQQLLLGPWYETEACHIVIKAAVWQHLHPLTVGEADTMNRKIKWEIHSCFLRKIP